MNRDIIKAVFATALAFATWAGAAQAQPAIAFDDFAPPPLVRAEPASVGLSSVRLARLTTAFNREVADKRLPGAVVMVARKGRLVYANAFGLRDPKAADPMRTDSIFRIYSMTKPLASVGAMLLVEDGVIQLSDPVAKWLPAFKDVKVWSSGGEVAAERAMTVQDLLRHTAGLAYGELTQNTAVKEALIAAGIVKQGVPFDARDMTGAEQVERLAKIPLLYQPGTTFEYSLAVDVLGRVIEAASGKRLGDFLSERLFGPLGMVDTAFWVSQSKQQRLAEPFEKHPVTGAAIKLIDVSKPPGNDSAGAGAVSTAGDYLRFAQMLLNGGVLDGERVMSRSTIKLMTSDHLGSRPIAPTPGGQGLAATTYTFGLGFAVRPSDGLAPVPGSAGDFNWLGYACTWFWVDPTEQIVAVLMVQEPGPLSLYHRTLLKQLVYQAIAD
jgi:CubicO group peptidase (beta-lactamase class C family)